MSRSLIVAIVSAVLSCLFNWERLEAAGGPESRWPLAKDARATPGDGPHGENHGATFGVVAGRPAATFDGTGSHVTIPNAPSLALGKGDFTIATWVHTEADVDDDLGDIASHFDASARKGFHLTLRTNEGVASSQPNFRQLQFGIDSGTEPVFVDEGRPGNAIFGQSIAVHDGRLYVGTCVAAADQAGHVYRYEGPGRWSDLGSPDKANSITSMAAWKGELYVASGKYRLKGTALPESENQHLGGRIYRLRPDSTWEQIGHLPDVEAVAGMGSFRGKLHAASLYKPAGLFSYEGGDRWTSVATPDGKRVEHLGVYDGMMYASSYDSGNVYRFDGRSWTDLGPVGESTQTYGFTVHRGALHVATWPAGKVYQWGGSGWRDYGRLGMELEVMGMLVHNGCLYAGSLPLGQVYRRDGDRGWTLLEQLDRTPDVKMRRVWGMAQHDGRLFATTIPSGHVWSMRTGACVTWDKEFPSGWHHVTAQRQADELRLFVDGALVARSTAGGAAGLDIDCDGDWRVGAGSGSFFCGSLAGLEIHRRALSTEEVARLAAAR